MAKKQDDEGMEGLGQKLGGLAHKGLARLVGKVKGRMSPKARMKGGKKNRKPTMLKA